MIDKIEKTKLAPLSADKVTIQELREELRSCKRNYRALLRKSQHGQLQAKKYSQLLLLEQEEDRKEISRELHDEVAQMLTGITINLEILNKETKKCADRVRSRIFETQKLVEDSVKSIHRYAKELRPMVLDDLGLLPALRTYAREFSEQTRIPITLEMTGNQLNLDEIGNTILFRITQEALINVARHSNASRVLISLSVIDEFVVLEIKDNGKSFDVNSVRTSRRGKRMGMIGMQERAKMANGKLVIVSTPGSGTSVKALIPNRPRRSKPLSTKK